MGFSTSIAGQYIPSIPDEQCLFRVDVSDDMGRSFATNGLRWATQQDASDWGRDLACRWFGCTDIRVVRESDDEVVEVVL